MFEEGRFDPEKFNQMFELKNSKTNQLMKHKGAPTAFNLDGIGGGCGSSDTSFVSCEIDYNELYEENDDIDGTDLFASFKNNFGPDVNITDRDIRKMNSSTGSSNYNNHNVVDDDYKAEIERRMKEREQEDEMYDSRKLKDYKNDDDTMGGYGFLYQVGLTGEELEWDKEEMDDDALRKLLKHREEEVGTRDN